jgi:Predicted Zn-dependent hydrolases of the beta-lactamase fold
MRIEYFGHSCFKIEGERGVRILTDPFDSSVGYKLPDVEADIVSVSHDHFDHNYTEAIRGDFKLINKTGIFYVRDININGIISHHDNVNGKKRGDNIIYTFDVDGIKVCHLGDLGHTLNSDQVARIGGVDVLLIPVGGYYTIDANDAVKVIGQLKPSIVMPMHYKTPVVDFPIEPVDVFLNKVGGGEKLTFRVLDIKKEDLDGSAKVYVLNYE